MAHYIQGTKRPQRASSGCLKEIKTVKKNKQLSGEKVVLVAYKRLLLFMRGSC